MKIILRDISLTSVGALAIGALLLLATNGRSAEQFGICKRHPNGPKECLMTFNEEQWRFLGSICDKK